MKALLSAYQYTAVDVGRPVRNSPNTSTRLLTGLKVEMKAKEDEGMLLKCVMRTEPEVKLYVRMPS